VQNRKEAKVAMRSNPSFHRTYAKIRAGKLMGIASEFGKNRTLRHNISSSDAGCSTVTVIVIKTHNFGSDVLRTIFKSHIARIGAGKAAFSRLSLKNLRLREASIH
jgi:hypothetical protein